MTHKRRKNLEISYFEVLHVLFRTLKGSSVARMSFLEAWSSEPWIRIGSGSVLSLKCLCRGSCFLSYTAESSHHPMVAFTPKEALCQKENITVSSFRKQNIGRMASLYLLM
jgi:hypothetical protein